jgi:hypothetical protein
MDKFEIYALRNIFVLPSSSNNSDITNTTISSSHSLKRQRYIELAQENAKIKQQNLLGESILSDINSALFSYRVGNQSLDAHDVNPISETIHNILNSSEILQEMTNRANCKYYIFIIQ